MKYQHFSVFRNHIHPDMPFFEIHDSRRRIFCAEDHFSPLITVLGVLKKKLFYRFLYRLAHTDTDCTPITPKACTISHKLIIYNSWPSCTIVRKEVEYYLRTLWVLCGIL